MEQILHRTNELEATARQLAQQLEDLQKQTIRTVIQSKWLLADEFSSQEKEKEDAIIRCPLCGHSGKNRLMKPGPPSAFSAEEKLNVMSAQHVILFSAP